jgi:DNA-binding SARP family transcriptional activator/ActR/RegA family two-component response regulator
MTRELDSPASSGRFAAGTPKTRHGGYDRPRRHDVACAETPTLFCVDTHTEFNVVHAGHPAVNFQSGAGQIGMASSFLRPVTDSAALIADNDPRRRRTVGRILTDAGFTVHEAATAAEALLQAERWRPSVAVVDRALRGPGGDGVVAAMRTNPVTRDLPVLVLTPRDRPDEAATALAEGADDFVTTPLDADELRVRVAALASRPAPSPGTRGPGFRIELFGPLRVYVDRRAVIDERFARRKVKALLAFLWLRRGDCLSREELVEALWPESDPQLARGRLKQTVLVLRTIVEAPRSPGADWRYIQEKGGAYCFNVDADAGSDVEDFERELGLAREVRERGDADAALRAYRRAFALRRSEFLPEFRSEEWAVTEATRLDDLYLQSLEEASEVYAAGGQYARAVELLCQVIREDPLRERAYPALMRYLWLERKHVEALRVYQRLRDVLASALEVAPDAEATQLSEAIRRDRAAVDGASREEPRGHLAGR